MLDLDDLMALPVPELRRSSGFNTFQYSDLDLQTMPHLQDLLDLTKPDEKEFEDAFSTEQEKVLPE